MSALVPEPLSQTPPALSLAGPSERRRLVELTDGLVEELDRLTDLAPDAESSRSLRAHLAWAVAEARAVLPNDRYLAQIEGWLDEPGALLVKDARLHLRMVRQSLSCAANAPASLPPDLIAHSPADDYHLWLSAATG